MAAALVAGSVHSASVLMGSTSKLGVAQPLVLAEGNGTSINGTIYPIRGAITAPRFIDIYSAINVSTTIMPIVDPVSLLRTYSGTLFVSYNNTGNFVDAGQCYNFSYGQHTIVCRYKNNANSPIGLKSRGALFFKIRVNSAIDPLGSGTKNITEQYMQPYMSYNTSVSKAVVVENLTLTPESTVVFVGQPVTFTNRTTKSNDVYTNYTYTVEPSANFTRVGNTFVFSRAGEYLVTLEASTANGKEHVKDSVKMHIMPPFVNYGVTMVVPENVIYNGLSETLTASVSGGDAPYAYSWMVNGNKVGTNASTLEFYGNATTLANSPDAIAVQVTDASGNSVAANAAIAVYDNNTNNTHVPKTIDEYWAINVSTTVMPIVDPISLLRTYSGTLFVSYNNTGNFVDAGQCYNFSYGQHTIVCRYKNNAKSPIGLKSRGALFFKIRVNSTIVPLDSKDIASRYTQSYNTSVSRAVVVENLTLTPESTVVFTGQPVTFTNRTTKSNDVYTKYTYTVTPNANFTRVGNTFVFSRTGTYTVSLEASTSNGKEHVKDSANMVVLPTPGEFAVKLDVPYKIIMAGRNETITANVSGGDSHYTYSWSINGKPVGENSSVLDFVGNASAISGSPDMVTVYVKDGSGLWGEASAMIRVSPIFIGSAGVQAEPVDINGSAKVLARTYNGSYYGVTGAVVRDAMGIGKWWTRYLS